MAVTWGSTNGHIRVGIDVSMSPAQVTAATTSVVLTWTVYAQSVAWGFNDPQTMNLTGSVSASKGYTLSSGTGQTVTVQVGTWQQTISTSTTGPLTRTLTAKVSGAYNGAAPYASRSITIPQRVIDPPVAPSSPTAKWVSDKQINVTWGRPSGSGSWTSLTVQRRTSTTGSWVNIAQLAGTASSYSDTTVTSNNAFTYRVRATNQAGSTDSALTATVRTTPAAPSQVTARRAGKNVALSWVDNSPANVAFEVQDGTTTTVATPTQGPYTVSGSDPSVAHTYRVRATGDPSRPSAWASVTVPAIAPPSPPSALMPSSTVAATGTTPTFTWTHETADTTAQTAFEIRTSTDAGATWQTSGKRVSSSSRHVADASLTEADATVQWQVRNWGDHANPSEWSALASFQVTSPPSANVTSPEGTWDRPAMTISWAYYQAAGHAQVAWRVLVSDGSDIVWDQSGSGATSQVTTGPIFGNGDRVRVHVQVMESMGLWSPWDSVDVVVAYAPPLAPQVQTIDQLERGFVEVIAEAQSDGEAPDTVSLRLERQIDEGPWELLGDDLPLSVDIIDWTPTIGGTNRYRVTAVSALPSTASTTAEVSRSVSGSQLACAVIVAGGPSFGVTCFFSAATASDLTVGRDRTLTQYAGRRWPVETSGLQTPRVVAARAFLDAGGQDATRDQVQQLFEMPGPHLYRDSLGRRFWCSLSSVTLPAEYTGEISFSATQADPGTLAQQASIAEYTGAVIVEASPGEYVILGGSTLEQSPGEYVWASEGVTIR